MTQTIETLLELSDSKLAELEGTDIGKAIYASMMVRVAATYPDDPELISSFEETTESQLAKMSTLIGAKIDATTALVIAIYSVLSPKQQRVVYKQYGAAVREQLRGMQIEIEDVSR